MNDLIRNKNIMRINLRSSSLTKGVINHLQIYNYDPRVRLRELLVVINLRSLLLEMPKIYYYAQKQWPWYQPLICELWSIEKDFQPPSQTRNYWSRKSCDIPPHPPFPSQPTHYPPRTLCHINRMTILKPITLSTGFLRPFMFTLLISIAFYV